MIKEFLEALKIMEDIHRKKNADYASTDNPFSNFDCSEYGLTLFPNPRDGAFAWPIFTKLSRLSTLLNKTEEPNNESVEDSFIDIANYMLLWRADIIRRKSKLSEPMSLMECKECFKRWVSLYWIGGDGPFCSEGCKEVYSTKHT